MLDRDNAKMMIGELAAATGTKINTIRFYEAEGLLPTAERSAGGRRVYASDDLRRLSFIRKCRNLGFPLASVKELLRLADDAAQPCDTVDRIARAHLEEIKTKIRDLKALHGELARMIASCHKGLVANCKIIETLSP